MRIKRLSALLLSALLITVIYPIGLVIRSALNNNAEN